MPRQEKSAGEKALHDFNCGLKAYRKVVVKNIEVYGEMHRYIPIWQRMPDSTESVKRWFTIRQENTGNQVRTEPLLQRISGSHHALVPQQLRQKPMHVFGFLGTVVFIIGFIAAFIIGADKLWALSQGIPQRLVTDSPYFYISLTMMMIGTQLFLAGFWATLVSRSSQNRNDYQIEEEIKCGK